MNWDGLDIALSVPGTVAVVAVDGRAVSIRWMTSDDREVANARFVVLADGEIEWTKFWVEFEARGRGIFTRALELQEGWFQEHGFGPSLIRKNANDASFYRQAGFVDHPSRPEYMFQDPKRSNAWLESNGVHHS